MKDAPTRYRRFTELLLTDVLESRSEC